jgi:molybdopterin-containing oxidoreductase family molybdopterin binding subunit
MNPGDAAGRAIADGQQVRVYNERGSVLLKARLSFDIKPGVAVISEGSWVKDFIEGDPYSLTHELVSPTSENYAFFDTLVEIEPIASAPT